MGFHLVPEAESELDSIWLYIASESRSIDLANRFIDGVMQRCWLLGQHPQVGRRRDHDLRPGLRSFLVGEYVIIYCTEADNAIILHIMHGSRDIEGLLNSQ